MINGLHCNPVDKGPSFLLTLWIPVTLLVVSTYIIMWLKFGAWWHVYYAQKLNVNCKPALGIATAPAPFPSDLTPGWSPQVKPTDNKAEGTKVVSFPREGRWRDKTGRKTACRNPPDRLSRHPRHHSFLRDNVEKGGERGGREKTVLREESPGSCKGALGSRRRLEAPRLRVCGLAKQASGWQWKELASSLN